MESPERTTGPPDGPYPEEMLLEAFELEWEAIELRRQRLRKTWQQFQLIHEMEMEELKYQRQRRRIMAQEKERKEKLEELEALRRENEKQAVLIKEKERREKLAALIKEKERRERLEQEDLRRKEEETALVKEKERLRAETPRLKAEKQKRMKQVAVSDSQTDEVDSREYVKAKKVKDKVKTQSKQAKKAKRITPVSLPPAPQPETDESFTEENQFELGGYDSPPPELPADGLLDMLSFEKSSDSDIDDEPSIVSLILPVAQSSPKRPQPSPSKKKMTPQKRFANRKGPPLDFDFTNAEAKRHAKAAKAAARAEQDEVEESDSEPEPMPAPSTSTPKKRLKKRRKEVAKERQEPANTTAATGRKNLMVAMADSTITIKPKKNDMADKAATAGNNMRKKNGAAQGKAKSQTKENDIVDEKEIPTTPVVKKKARGNGEKMTIKQRLANAELLARMNKMQDINTPKVLGKKTKNTQKKAATKTLAAKRAEFRKALSSEETTDPDVHRGNQDIEDRDLNISLNSSGLISDNDSPGNLRAPTRKRSREAVDGDVTPTKKLQFLEITKRLTKSPMPRFLRTPTPLMSPGIASAALVNPRAASPARRMASSRTTADKAVNDAARRMNSAPVRPKKTTNVNKFGAHAGGANTAASGSGFSMFDAFVNSGSSGAIPQLKTKTRGDISPSV